MSCFAAAGEREHRHVTTISRHAGQHRLGSTRIAAPRRPELAARQADEIGASQSVSGLLPRPVLIRFAALADPTHSIASFTAHKRDAFAIRHEAESRLVWMARHIKMRNQVIVDSISTGEQPELRPVSGQPDHLQACYLDETTKDREAAMLLEGTMAEAV